MPWISYPRVDRFIEVHEQGFYTGADEERDRRMADSAALDVPTYCPDSRAHAFKKPVPYPFDEVLASLPIAFLEDSVAHMIALAIYEGCDELGLWGVHMMGAYQSHRPSVTYLIGLAQGKGIEVTIPPGCPLFMSLYVHGRYGITPETRY